MTPELRRLVSYRMNRAKECLVEAGLLAGHQHWNSCLNRLYYACFYAASALLIAEGHESSKHSGSRSLFNLHFVKTGRMDKELAACFNDLFDLRQESDYEDFFHCDPAIFPIYHQQAERFLEAAE